MFDITTAWRSFHVMENLFLEGVRGVTARGLSGGERVEEAILVALFAQLLPVEWCDVMCDRGWQDWLQCLYTVQVLLLFTGYSQGKQRELEARDNNLTLQGMLTRPDSAHNAEPGWDDSNSIRFDSYHSIHPSSFNSSLFNSSFNSCLSELFSSLLLQ